MKNDRSMLSVVLIALLLLLVAYAGSYSLAMKPLEIWFDPNIDGVGSAPEKLWGHRAFYFGGDLGSTSQRIGEIVYFPIHYLDQQWRPDYWECAESRQLTAFINSLPTGPNGNKVLSLPTAASYQTPMLEYWPKFAYRICQKWFWLIAVHDYRAGHCVGIFAQVKWMLTEDSADDTLDGPVANQWSEEGAIEILPLE